MLSADEIASVIIARTGPWIDAMRLQKLLYYVQAWHLAITAEPLFHEQIKAWRDGPVIPQVWHARRGQESRRAAAQVVKDLEPSTSDLIDLVLGVYGSMSGEELRALTHVEQPWLEARGELLSDDECREPISHESMARFYRAHRSLGGRSAADLAAGGIHLRSRRARGPVDVAAILAEIPSEFDDPGDDTWGSANLDTGDRYDSEGITQVHARAHTSV